MGEALVFMLIFGAVMLIVILASVVQAQAKKKRQTELLDFAMRRGFVLHPNEESGCGSFLSGYSTGGSILGSNDFVAGGQVAGRLGSMFQGFSPFGVGHSRLIYNAMTGELPWGTFYGFDYRYVTGGGKNRHEHRYGIVAFRVPLNFVKLGIRPEGFMDALGGALGLRDIQFESDEFNREYHVRSENDRFAFDILHPAMMEFLLSLQRLNWQFMGPYIVLIEDGNWPVPMLDSLIATVERFVQLIPDYVRQDIGFHPQWTTSFE
jgi:hypothetical protein